MLQTQLCSQQSWKQRLLFMLGYWSLTQVAELTWLVCNKSTGIQEECYTRLYLHLVQVQEKHRMVSMRMGNGSHKLDTLLGWPKALTKFLCSCLPWATCGETGKHNDNRGRGEEREVLVIGRGWIFISKLKHAASNILAISKESVWQADDKRTGAQTGKTRVQILVYLQNSMDNFTSQLQG